jgi:hypothetical protein
MRSAPVQDVHLPTLHEPYEAPEHPVPINATIVHALTLLHPAVAINAGVASAQPSARAC